ncbi:GNAT family N-acetyltransferase [Zophobihabitans entericus]|uniref:GNAT family N-acetyltransferase n=1 Tax=Zophobihabitans entericus TaxID=1635327 RepID=A0A6G9ICL1_9GAMM|nr:GNAT family N-acetyltransferase [Zophobihabitans entericus]QIQ21577.1 GNAT family N-acetyltransferase [Zophobihabitans entericus]
MIKTDNLVLRLFKPDDLSDVQTLLADPKVIEFSAIDPFSAEESLLWLSEQIDSYDGEDFKQAFAITLPETDKVIGYCCLEKMALGIIDDIEVSVVIASEYWNKGYATEAVTAVINYAFNQRGIRRLIAVVNKDNIVSQRLFKKIGFIEEELLTIEGIGVHSVMAVINQ